MIFLLTVSSRNILTSVDISPTTIVSNWMMLMLKTEEEEKEKQEREREHLRESASCVYRPSKSLPESPTAHFRFTFSDPSGESYDAVRHHIINHPSRPIIIVSSAGHAGQSLLHLVAIYFIIHFVSLCSYNLQQFACISTQVEMRVLQIHCHLLWRKRKED